MQKIDEDLQAYGNHLQKQLFGLVDHDPNDLHLGFRLPCRRWTPERIRAIEQLLNIHESRIEKIKTQEHAKV